MEAEPLLKAFIDEAVEPRLRAMGITEISLRDAMGNLAAFSRRPTPAAIP